MVLGPRAGESGFVVLDLRSGSSVVLETEVAAEHTEMEMREVAGTERIMLVRSPPGRPTEIALLRVEDLRALLAGSASP
jgi:hypothetical protein